MNNLKRVLSLGLAGTMLTGMMMVGTSAANVKDFTDSSEIKNQEAVTTMSALGVIKGKDTGAFDPSGNVTRAEMAKMITVMLNGGKDPVLGTKATPSYTDIGGHWAESYIEYCSTQGVISGQGDGTFNPDGSVTGSQAAKMALAALGYDSSAYNFTGIDWEVNTNRVANADADLYDGLSGINPSEAISRDNAAQMLYNTLDATTKKMTPTTSTNGSIEYTYTDGGSFMQEKFGAVKVEGVVTGNEMATLTTSATGSHLDDNRTRILVTNYGTGNGEQTSFGNAAGTLAVTVQAVTGLDELGRSVSVYVKTGSSASKAEIMGDVIVSEDNVVVTDYSGDPISDVADDNSLNLIGTTQTLNNYASQAVYSASVAGNRTRGVEKVLIDHDGDGDVDYVLLNTYRLGRVTSYVTTGDGSITVNAGAGNTFTKSDADDVVGFEDVARNDYVIAAEIGGRLHVEKAETVSGELTAYRSSTDSNNVLGGGAAASYSNRLSIDGTNYNVAWLTGYINGTDNIQPAYNYGSTFLNNTATFYLGKGDYVLGVGDATESAYNYALVLAADTANVSDQVRVALSDGTKATYTVNSNGHTYNASNNLSDNFFTVGSLCSYTIASNGTIRLTEVANITDTVGDKTTSSNASFTKGRTGLTVGASTAVYTNSSTAFFYVKDGDLTDGVDSKNVSTYTGYTSATSVTGANALYYKNAAGQAVAVVFYDASLSSNADVDDFVYIYGTGNSNNDYTDANAFVAGSDGPQDLQVDGKVMAYAAGGATLDASITASEGLYKYSITTEGYYDLEPIANYVKSSGGNKLVSDYNASTNPSGKTYGVYSASGSTVVIGEWDASSQAFDKAGTLFEVKITKDTMLIDDSSDLDDPTMSYGDTPSEGDRVAYLLVNLDNNVADEAMAIVLKRNQAVAAKPAPTVGTATLANGGSNPLTVGGTTVMVEGSSVSATAATYGLNTADTVKVTFGAPTGGANGQITYTLNGGASTNYTSGADIVLPGTGLQTLVFTVPVTGDSTHSDATFTFTVAITVS